jgi:hypothetical protein
VSSSFFRPGFWASEVCLPHQTECSSGVGSASQMKASLASQDPSLFSVYFQMGRGVSGLKEEAGRALRHPPAHSNNPSSNLQGKGLGRLRGGGVCVYPCALLGLLRTCGSQRGHKVIQVGGMGGGRRVLQAPREPPHCLKMIPVCHPRLPEWGVDRWGTVSSLTVPGLDHLKTPNLPSHSL